MIFENDKMMYQNVFSMKFITSIYDIKKHIDNFVAILAMYDAKSSNEMFYTISDIKSEDEIYFEIFQSVDDYVEIPNDKIMFRTYYVHDNMISTYILNDFDKIEWSYGRLILWMKEKKEIPLSNIYNEIHKLSDNYYIIAKVAVGNLEDSM